MTLKELRKKRGLTQIEMARELGVSGKTVSLIEVGRLKLSKKLSDRILEVYGEAVEPAAGAAAPETGKKTRKRGRGSKAGAQEDKSAAAEAAPGTAVEAGEKPAKKARRGRPPKAAAAEKKPAEKKPAKAAAKKKAPALVIQSPFGGEITPDEISAKIGEADVIYVRVDQNKAYWVKGEDSGAVDLW